MKKVFSSLLLIFLIPLKQIKKIKKNNFLLGLIFGAIFSLLVNLITSQIQTKIDKQRILEGLEVEIATNNLLAFNQVTSALKSTDDKLDANPYMIAHEFSNDFWVQSAEPKKYVSQLDPKVQGEINAYYSITIPYANQLIETLNQEYVDSMKNCFDFETVRPKEEQDACNHKYYVYLQNIALYPGKNIHKDGTKLLKNFHPTKDRMNNYWLKLLMGTSAMTFLYK